MHAMNETLEFCKKVLSRVSFDRALFAKELKKSFLIMIYRTLLGMANEQFCINQDQEETLETHQMPGDLSGLEYRLHSLVRTQAAHVRLVAASQARVVTRVPPLPIAFML